MKYLIPIVVLSLCSGCATRKPLKSESVATVSGTAIPRKKMSAVRTPETVKAYPAGRYTDPNYPDAMHERHTVYRREQSPDWNYLPDPPYALPLGPTVATSNPSPSYYIKTDSELMNAQQRAYAEALREQNRALQKRIEALQQEAGKVPGLEQEIERLEKQLDTIPSPPPSAAPSQPEPVASEADDVFSNVEPPLPAWDEFIDSAEVGVFIRTNDPSQASLIAQMQLNDERAAKLEALERRKLAALFHSPLLRRKEWSALFTQHTP